MTGTDITFKEKIALSFATGFGLGRAPVAPGTVASAVAVLIYAILPSDVWFWLFIILVFYFTGVYCANLAEKKYGKDPGIVVIDEFTGQWLALLYLPSTFPVLVLGFLAFRFFDILKPPPARQIENFSGGTGIMLDDVVAGIYANITVQIILNLFTWR